MSTLASPNTEQPGVARLLTALDVAAFLRISRSSVYKLDRRGDLPCVRILGGSQRIHRRWRQSDVEAYVDRQLRGTPEGKNDRR